MEETKTAETRERERREEHAERFEAERFETSESPEAKSSEISESSKAVETDTTEYGSSERETETATETAAETETEAETETQTQNSNSVQGNDADGGTDLRTEVMQEFYDTLTSSTTVQEYYTEMLGYADSINHTCTIVLNLCLAILLCAGIIAGSMIAHSFWSKFK